VSRALSRLDSPQKPRAGIQVNECNGPSMRRPVGVKSTLISFCETTFVLPPSGHCRHASIRTLEERFHFARCMLGVPVSAGAAICWAPNASPRAFAVVRTRCSCRIWPASSSMQYQLLRSPRSNPNGQCLLRKIPALLRRNGANLFHCRSPFYLCLEHVDNLGAYSIPSGDRPSHPIWLQHLLADFPQADFRPASLNVCSEA